MDIRKEIRRECNQTLLDLARELNRQMEEEFSRWKWYTPWRAWGLSCRYAWWSLLVPAICDTVQKRVDEVKHG